MSAENRGAAALTDAAAERRLASYRRLAALCTAGAAVCTVGCVVLLIFFRAQLPAAALFAAAAGCILAAAGVQKRTRSLLERQLNGFFREEFEARFGPAPTAPELRIDRALMETLFPPEGEWTACETEGFCEGSSCGTAFSAAAVRLERLVQTSNIHDGRQTRRETVRRCFVLRLWADAAGLTEPLSARLGTAAQELGMPLLASAAEDGCVTLALDTDFSVSPLPDRAVSETPDALRRRWIAALDRLEQVLTAFREALS